MPLTIPNLGLGLNLHDPATEIANGEMAGGRNILFSRGVLKTPYGFAQVAAADLPLTGAVIGLCHYAEQGASPSNHVVAMTRTKLYRWNTLSGGWSDISPAAALTASLDSVPSFVAFPHTDAIEEDGVDCYYHLLASDGGHSPVQRWAGKYEDTFYPLEGGDGYHATDADPATPVVHYCDQIAAFYNSVILLNPKTWNATTNRYEENKQALYWGKAGLLEVDSVAGTTAYDGTGAGYVALVDAGGSNVRCALLGNSLIVYQDNSLWYLYHVGGTDTFLAKLEIPGLGLLAPGLLVTWRNRHFFLGSDYQPYSYAGGSFVTPIGVKIAEALKADLDPTRLARCRMEVGANGSRLWIFVVRDGYEFITRAYGIDTLTGAWMVRDFEHLYDTTTGLSSVALVGAQSYVVGSTWQQAIDTAQTYAEAIVEGTTWEQLMTVQLTRETMMLGDQDGYVYQYDEDLTADNGVDIPAYALTKIFDFGTPHEDKWLGSLYLTAQGDSVRVSYRIDSFETEDDGWQAFDPITLTDTYRTYEIDLSGITADQIQFKIANYSGGAMTVKKIVLEDPVLI